MPPAPRRGPREGRGDGLLVLGSSIADADVADLNALVEAHFPVVAVHAGPRALGAARGQIAGDELRAVRLGLLGGRRSGISREDSNPPTGTAELLDGGQSLLAGAGISAAAVDHDCLSLADPEIALAKQYGSSFDLVSGKYACSNAGHL